MQKSITTLLSTSLLAIAFFGIASAQLTDTLDSANVSTCVQLTKGMTFGSRDATTDGQVSDLQFFLNDKGYLKTDPTGYFGAATVAAVKEFQGANGITQNGVVGPITRGKIATISCSRDEPTTGGTDPVTTNPTTPVSQIGNLSVTLSYTGGGTNGSAIIIPSNSSATGVNPLSPRTWSWRTTGAASVSARYTISGENCGQTAGLKVQEEGWQPWLGTNITGNRFLGSNTRSLDASYYGCTVEATYKARNVDNQVVSSTVKVVFAEKNGTTPVTYICNGVQQTTPCTTVTNPVACTMDAKVCPDGSYVGRTGPSCAFEACPTTPTVPSTTTIRLDQLSAIGSMFIIGSDRCDEKDKYVISYGDGKTGQVDENFLLHTTSGAGQSPSCSGYIALHKYQQPGTYLVKLTRSGVQVASLTFTIYACNGLQQTTPCTTTIQNCPIPTGMNVVAPPQGCTITWTYDATAGCNKPTMNCPNVSCPAGQVRNPAGACVSVPVTVPVCGQPPMPYCPVGVSCIQAFPQPKTYANMQALQADGAGFISIGACPQDAPLSISDYPATKKAISSLVVKLGVSTSSISVVSVTEKTWPDGCLGIAPPSGSACTMALVPGYLVSLSHGGVVYNYRTNLSGSFAMFDASSGLVCPVYTLANPRVGCRYVNKEVPPNTCPQFELKCENTGEIKYTGSNSPSGPFVESPYLYNNTVNTLYFRITGVKRTSPIKICTQLVGKKGADSCDTLSNFRTLSAGEWFNDSTIQIVLAGGTLQNGTYETFFVDTPGKLTFTKIGTFFLKSFSEGVPFMTSLIISPSSGVDTDSFRVKWSGTNNPTRYSYKTPNSLFVQAGAEDINSKIFSAKSLGWNQGTHTMSVSACNSVGCGPFSSSTPYTVVSGVSCPAGQVSDATGSCVMCPLRQLANPPAGCRYVNKEVPPNTCPDFELKCDNSCPVGQVSDATGSCVMCPLRQLANPPAGCRYVNKEVPPNTCPDFELKCENICPAGQVSDATGSSCVSSSQSNQQTAQCSVSLSPTNFPASSPFTARFNSTGLSSLEYSISGSEYVPFVPTSGSATNGSQTWSANSLFVGSYTASTRGKTSSGQTVQCSPSVISITAY